MRRAEPRREATGEVARRPQINAEALLAAQRAARGAGQSAVIWWRRIAAGAGAAVTEQSLDEVLRRALAAVREVLDADEVSLLVSDDQAGGLIARASVGLDAETTTGLHIPAGGGMAGRVLASGEPLLVPDLSMIELASSTLRDEGFRSVVAVPMLVEGRPTGVMHAGSRVTDAFGPADVEVLSAMADELAVAVERVRLFEHERESRRLAERLADRMVRVQRVTTVLATLSASEDLAAAVAVLLAPDAGDSPGRTVTLLLVDGDRLSPVLPAGGGPEGDGGQARGAAGSAAGGGPEGDGGNPEPLLLSADDPRAEAARSQQPVCPAGEATSHKGSVVAVPIVLRGETLGVLVIDDPAGSHPDGDELSFLRLVAEQLALALERARLFAEQARLSAVSSFFAHAARVTAEADGLAETLERLASIALYVLGDLCLIDVAGEDGKLNRMVARHRDPARQHLVQRLRSEFPPDPGGAHPAAEVISTGTTRWSREMSDDFLRATTRSTAHFALVKQLGFRSYLSVPLAAGSEVLGSVTLVSTGRPFDGEDVDLAERLAQQVAAVVANARRYDATFRTSHLLQESLLPRSLPDLPGLEVHTRYLAASRGLEVGGDFYDLIRLPSGHAGLMIGDVAGHDGDAAAMMGHLRSAIRALAGQVAGPAELVAGLQWSWPLLGFERIATALFGWLDPADGELLLASAGHYPPLVVSRGEARFLPLRPSIPLGAAVGNRPSRPAEQLATTLGEGDLLLFYTDGAIDERGAGPDASMAELARAVASGTPDPRSVCERVVELLDPDRADDVALLAIRRTSGFEHPTADPGRR